MTKKDLLAQTKKDLLDMAAKHRISGRSGMTKRDLVDAIIMAIKSKKAPRKAEPVVSSGAGVRPARPPKRVATPVRESTLVRRSWREQQVLVQHAKYEAKPGEPAPPKAARPAKAFVAETVEVPPAYGQNRIVLLVRDPYWIHVYWDVSREALLAAKSLLKDEWYEAKSVLRVYDVTGLDFDGKNAHSFFDIAVQGGATNWYINTGIPNRTYCVDVGLLSKSGRFVMLARSNKATTPRDTPSDVVDEKWMIPDWEFEKVYALSGGFNVGASSLELKELMQRALGGELGSGAVGSLAISSPVGGERVRGFWFRLGTELIVYGATQPDAKVTLQGKPIKLKPDGTFSVRFALPDGKQVIPAVAESKDGVDKITITPIVSKKTQE